MSPKANWLRALTAGACLLACATAQAAEAALIEAAKKEGRVLWYTTLIVNQVVIPLKTAFEKKYPGVTLDYARNDEGPTAIRLLNEAKAGKVQADVFDGLTVNVPLKREGLLARIEIPNAADYPAEMKDADGAWHALLLFVFTPGFNTTLVSKADAPKTYEDLLDPRWKGKMAWNPNSSAGAIGFVGNILLSMGQDAGMDYLRALAKQNIVNVEASSRAILDPVIAGEYPLALCIFNHHAVLSAQKGAPVDWIKLNPIAAPMQVTSLVKNCAHPNAGKLLIDFIASEQGQKVLAGADYLPAMPSVEAKTPSLKPEKGDFTPLYFPPDLLGRDGDRWDQIYKTLFR